MFGLLTSILENGIYAGPIFYSAEKEAERICKGIKCTIIDEDEDENVQPVMVTARKKGFINTVEQIGHCIPEVIKDKPGLQDVLRNIAAAVNHFGIRDSEDMQTVRIQITAILYMSGLSDTDTVFEALNKDAAAYAMVNELVRMYNGEAMDERLIQMDIGKDINDAVCKKLKMLADWEMNYLADHIHVDSDVLADRIKTAHENIINYLARQSKKHVGNGQDIKPGGSEDSVWKERKISGENP